MNNEQQTALGSQPAAGGLNSDSLDDGDEDDKNNRPNRDSQKHHSSDD